MQHLSSDIEGLRKALAEKKAEADLAAEQAANELTSKEAALVEAKGLHEQVSADLANLRKSSELTQTEKLVKKFLD